MDVKQKIINIKGRPKMFISELRVDYIYHYLEGYLSCFKEFKLSIEDDINLIFFSDFSHWTHEWINKNLAPVDFSFVWYKMIKDATKNEDDATNLFFRISDEFFEEFSKSSAK